MQKQPALWFVRRAFAAFGLPEKGRPEASASAKPKPFQLCRLPFLFLCPKSSLHSV
ncbi:hypothetical protein HMPREF9098_0954 [Kingella denitrificans ATCC 33394]|uniref:Uncharacterized protein n=1 Tax=Kingella denitrificans ATCC 33394 TaxID=888741 RepID=F0EYM0_9NEIS|nr:hypothetical protein HMPREF9098_0954 [Kingella denitrificans ATCC 33394]